MTRWPLSIYQSVSLQNFFDFTLRDLQCASLSFPDGRTVAVYSRDPSDTATLPAMATQCQQYLNLKDGDLALCNDPYSGGTQLSDLSLITAVGAQEGSAAEFLLGQRLRFPAGFSQSGKLQDEGIRIPPTPLGTLQTPNLDILSAIQAHPLAPPDLAKIMSAAAGQLSLKCRYLRTALGDEQNTFKKAYLKPYFSDCKNIFQKQIGKLALGESHWSTRLNSGALVKLRLLVHEEKILFDFSGSEESAFVNLTELATFGVCFNSIATALGHPVPANAGTFEVLQVSAPAKTLLNAKFPAGTWRGMNEGLYEIATFIHGAFVKLNPSLAHSTGGGRSGYVEINFGNGLNFFDSLASGQGAKSDSEGISAKSDWLANEFTQNSISSIEKSFPIQVLQFGGRKDSAGKGRHLGGLGLQKSYRLLANAEVSWSFMESSSVGVQGGKPGSPAELKLSRANSEKETLPLVGKLRLKAGDELHFVSAGGAGYGEEA